MSQRLDDVTGAELPRLSSRQREQQREVMVDQINAIIVQCNHTTAAIRGLIARADAAEARLSTMELHLAWLSRPSWVERLWKRVR